MTKMATISPVFYHPLIGWIRIASENDVRIEAGGKKVDI